MTKAALDKVIDSWLDEYLSRERHYGAMLVGSAATGEYTEDSDIDLVLFIKDEYAMEKNDYQLSFYQGRLFSAIEMPLPQAMSFYSNARAAVEYYVHGFRTAKILRDTTGGALRKIKMAAEAFQWTAPLKFDARATSLFLLAGASEEAHKVMRYIKPDNKNPKDTTALQPGVLGMALCLPVVIALHKRMLCCGDNHIWRQVHEELGRDSAWVRGHKIGLGDLSGISAEDRESCADPAWRARTALEFYAETARVIDWETVLPEETIPAEMDGITSPNPHSREVIGETLRRIAERLA